MSQLVLIIGGLLVSCGTDATRSQTKKRAADDQVVDGAGDVDDGETPVEVGDEGGGEGEDEGEIGDEGVPGDPVEGEAFQFVVALDCDFRWDIVGEIIACDDCEMAFELSLARSGSGSCSGGEDRSGVMLVRNAGVYFEGEYWGYVFDAGGGYLTWNTLGYANDEQPSYYLGHVTY